MKFQFTEKKVSLPESVHAYAEKKYRDFALYVGQEPVGEAVSVWVLADLQTRALLRATGSADFGLAPAEFGPDQDAAQAQPTA